VDFASHGVNGCDRLDRIRCRTHTAPIGVFGAQRNLLDCKQEKRATVAGATLLPLDI
jgi:hypothetical protein